MIRSGAKRRWRRDEREVSGREVGDFLRDSSPPLWLNRDLCLAPLAHRVHPPFSSSVSLCLSHTMPFTLSVLSSTPRNECVRASNGDKKNVGFSLFFFFPICLCSHTLPPPDAQAVHEAPDATPTRASPQGVTSIGVLHVADTPEKGGGSARRACEPSTGCVRERDVRFFLWVFRLCSLPLGTRFTCFYHRVYKDCAELVSSY